MAIELIVCDVDGTMTDGSVWYGNNGLKLRQFSTLDGAGIARWKEFGKHFVMCTASNDAQNILDRAAWLDVNVFAGVDSKWELLSMLSQEMELEAEQICFMGNDVSDIPALVMCGYPACPNDAHPEVLYELSRFDFLDDTGTRHITKPTFVSTEKGGRGAVRHLVDWLIVNEFRPIFSRPLKSRVPQRN